MVVLGVAVGRGGLFLQVVAIVDLDRDVELTGLGVALRVVLQLPLQLLR